MNRDILEKLHKHSLTTFDDYIAEQKMETEDHKKIQAAKSEWQFAWAKLMETALVLEKIEI